MHLHVEPVFKNRELHVHVLKLLISKDLNTAHCIILQVLFNILPVTSCISYSEKKYISDSVVQNKAPPPKKNNNNKKFQKQIFYQNGHIFCMQHLPSCMGQKTSDHKYINL